MAPPALGREHIQPVGVQRALGQPLTHLPPESASWASAWLPAVGQEHGFLCPGRRGDPRKGEWKPGEASWAPVAGGSALGCPGRKGLLWRPGFSDFCVRCEWGLVFPAVFTGKTVLSPPCVLDSLVLDQQPSALRQPHCSTAPEPRF